MVLVRCTGYCMASCSCCSQDVTSPEFPWLSHLGEFPALWISRPCASVVPVQWSSAPCSPSSALQRWWLVLRVSLSGISFVGAFAVRRLLERTLPQHIPWLAFSSLRGSAACSALGCWLMAQTKNLTFLEPPTAGTESQSMCSSDWMRWKTGSVI